MQETVNEEYFFKGIEGVDIGRLYQCEFCACESCALREKEDCKYYKVKTVYPCKVCGRLNFVRKCDAYEEDNSYI